ncbi:MAG: hypothetical protein M9921_12145 [Fimbriimonadaceae bacterium]|nr:division/cell wall cluster transcriptional repressor MraZ [Chthonomonadaceae bacterium]MCO5297597.1 hypothetical protein [Fimbriimonadaceae bacterium]
MVEIDVMPPSDFKPLLGTDEATVDDKGRLLVGKKKRERLGDDFAIAIGPTGCLCAYPRWHWDHMVREMLRQDPMNLGRERFTRLWLSTADDDLKFDSQGRFVIPADLRKLGEIKDKVVLLGAGDRMEIWALAEYEKFMQNQDAYMRERREAFERAYFALTDRL